MFVVKRELALQYGEQKWGQAFIELKRSFRFIQIQSEQGDQQEVEGKLNLRLEGTLPYVMEWANGRQPVDFNSSAAYLGAVEVLFSRFFMLEKGVNDARGSRAAIKG